MYIIYKLVFAALIIAFAAAASALMAIRASAEPLTFTDRNGITYTLTPNGTDTCKMTVSGSGGMEDFLLEFNYPNPTTISSPYYSDRENITEVVIESDITHIGDYAFWNFNSLTAVSIPATVKTIGVSSFAGCNSLVSVTIPEGAEEIGDNAFNECHALTSVNLPNSLKSIGGRAFFYCNELRTIVIPEGVQTIGMHAFHSCAALTSVTLPSTLTSIGMGAFDWCALTDITIPEGVNSIERSTFFNCNALSRIIYKDGVTLGENAVPDTATQVKYTVDGGGAAITEIILGTGKTAVEIPQTVNGMTVAPITDTDLMKKVQHTHTGGAATCTQKAACTLCGLEYGDLSAHTGGAASCTAKAVCTVCGAEYGEMLPHNFVDGECTVCHAPDPGYTPPTATTPSQTEPSVTEPTETSPTVTEPTGTAPTGTAPSAPSYPSNPSVPSRPAATTAAVTEVTTVTTVTAVTTAAEVIYGDYTGEDVSVDAPAYADGAEERKPFGAVLLTVSVIAVLAAALRKSFL